MAISPPRQLKRNHWTRIQFELKYLKQFDSFEIKKRCPVFIFENRNKNKKTKKQKAVFMVTNTP